MKTSFVLAAFAGAATALDISAILALLQTLPQCGQVCITTQTTNAATFNCGTTDIDCLCASPKFGAAVISCIDSTCSPADAVTVKNGVSKICPTGASSVSSAASSVSSSTLTATSTSLTVTTALTNATTTATGNLSVSLTTSTKSTGTQTTATLTSSGTAAASTSSTAGVPTMAAQLGLAGALGFAALALF